MFVIAALAATAGLAQTARENTADAERLVKALEVHVASVVGEIGAGAGELTFAMARTVG
jgi:tRNA A58 N-methylase Trm61